MTAGAATLTQLTERQQRAAAELAALSQQLDKSAALQPLCSAWDGYRPRLQQAVQLAARLQQGQGELPALEARAKAAETQQSLAREALDALQHERGSEVAWPNSSPNCTGSWTNGARPSAKPRPCASFGRSNASSKPADANWPTPPPASRRSWMAWCRWAKQFAPSATPPSRR